MAVILISLALFENSVETKILVDVESQMLSAIQYKPIIWDYLHEKVIIFFKQLQYFCIIDNLRIKIQLKCCGVRGYLDWCIKENFDSKKNITGIQFLGSLVCTPPSSCCLDYKSDAEVNDSYQRYE